MGVTKTTTQEGNGPVPQVGQTVSIDYKGYLKDPNTGGRGAMYATPLTN